MSRAIIAICVNVFFWILKWVLYAFAAWLLFLAFHHHAHAQSWWTARDVPGKAVWTNISENKADLKFVADFNSNSMFYQPKDSLTQCFIQPQGASEKIYAHTDSEYWNNYSFRINDAERIPGRGTFKAGITSCEKKFGNDWLVMFVIEPWVKEPNYCSNIQYTSKGNVLYINHCVTDDLPEPLPNYNLTIDFGTHQIVNDTILIREADSVKMIRACLDRITPTRIEIPISVKYITAEEEDASIPTRLIISPSESKSKLYQITTFDDDDSQDEEIHLFFSLPKRVEYAEPALGDC